MLTKITTTRIVRTFLTYDMEWMPDSYEIRCIGVYDGEEYRAYKKVTTFLDCELTNKNRGKWFYAHFGGMADIQFLLPEFQRAGYTVRGSFSSSSAVVLHVSRGKNSWHFIDSFWTLPSSLAEIGQKMGMQKGGEGLIRLQRGLPPTYHRSPEGGEYWRSFDKLNNEELKWWYTYVPLNELIDYNERDCKILWFALYYFQLACLEMGGQLQMTLASTAMQLFRRKYLTRDILTDGGINSRAVKAYFSSRVEVYEEKADNCLFFDINSSFPYAMKETQPGQLRQIYSYLPNKLLDDDNKRFIAKVEVEIPDCYLPPLPYRGKENRVFFPTGKWETWLCDIDIRLLVENGGKIHAVDEVCEFDSMDDTAIFAEDIFQKRRKATSDWENWLYKIKGNSLYGKFAEGQVKQGLHIDPPLDTLNRLRNKYETEPNGATYMLMPGVWLEEVPDCPIPHRHVPLAMSITAGARRNVFNYLSLASKFYYVDTDGFAVDPEDSFPVGKELGDLKLEKIVVKIDNEIPSAIERYKVKSKDVASGGAQFYAPKLYRKGDVFKAKGFSLGKQKTVADKRIARERFEMLVEQREIEVTRMIRIRENLRDYASEGFIPPPGEKRIRKRFRNLTKKRFHYPNGSTRPWNVDELEK